eukprot:1137674-Pelagomonas_calceolata.AAC.1
MKHPCYGLRGYSRCTPALGCSYRILTGCSLQNTISQAPAPETCEVPSSQGEPILAISPSYQHIIDVFTAGSPPLLLYHPTCTLSVMCDSSVVALCLSSGQGVPDGFIESILMDYGSWITEKGSNGSSIWQVTGDSYALGVGGEALAHLSGYLPLMHEHTWRA